MGRTGAASKATSYPNRYLLKYVPAGIAMLNINLCYVFASQRWLEDYGLGSVESITGHSHYELFPEITDSFMAANSSALGWQEQIKPL